MTITSMSFIGAKNVRLAKQVVIQLLQMVSIIPYKSFKQRLQFVKDIERIYRKAKISICDGYIVVVRLEDDEAC
jgi:hypothetical protein